MPLFTKLPAFCMMCGKQHATNFQAYRGEVCSKDCHDELEWRRTLSIMGQVYRARPVSANPAELQEK